MQALAEAGNTDDAKSLVRESNDVAARDGILQQASEGLAQEGRIDEALVLAHDLQPGSYSVDPIVAIVASLFKSGQTDKLLTNLWYIIDCLAQESGIRTNRPSAGKTIAAISELLTKMGKTDEILAAGRSVPEGEALSFALRFIAAGLVKGGRIDVAEKALVEALAAARKIDNNIGRSRAISAVVISLAETDKTDDALAAARSIRYDDDLSHALAAIAKGLARHQSYRLARLTSERCSLIEDRFGAYIAILTEYAKAHDPYLQAELDSEDAIREAKFDRNPDLTPSNDGPGPGP